MCMEAFKIEEISSDLAVTTKVKKELRKIKKTLKLAEDSVVNDTPSKKKAKEDLTEIRKIKEFYERNRIDLGTEFNKPFNKFVTMYKEGLLQPILDAESLLDSKIKAYASIVIAEYKEDLEKYFGDLNTIKWLVLDMIKYKLTDADKGLDNAKKLVKQEIERIASELSAIEVLPNKEAVLVEFYKTLKLQDAITRVNENLEIAKKLHEGQVNSGIRLANNLVIDANADELSEVLMYLNSKGITYSIK